MTAHFMQAGRRFAASLMGVLLSATTLTAPLPKPRPQSQDAETIKARVRELQAHDSQARVRVANGSTVQGRIVRVDEDSFTIREKKTGRDITLPFSQVTEVKKKGLPKAVLIPAIVGEGTLLVLCAGPYPIGFLCRKDPS